MRQLGTSTINFREKFVMVIYTDGCIYIHGTVVKGSLYDDVTTKIFRGKIWCFKANKKHELPLQIFPNMFQTIRAVKV